MATRFSIVAYGAAAEDEGEPWVVSTHRSLEDAKMEYLRRFRFTRSIDHAVVMLDEGGNYDLEGTIKASGRTGLA